MMRCFLISAYGPIRDVFSFSSTHPIPIITKPTQVLVKVYAASIGQGDCKVISGDISLVIKKTFPFVPGFDTAGVVTAVGSGCKRIHVGDSVYGDLSLPGGSHAEYVVCDESLLAIKPHNMTYLQAATVPVSATSAYQAIHDYAKIKGGEKILILGGSGGVGHFAVQFARAAGAIVTATASTRNQAFLSKLGATTCIDYTTTAFEQVLAGQNYDIVLDCVGGNGHFMKAKQVLKKGGHFIALTFEDPDAPATFRNLASQMGIVISRKLMSWFGDVAYSLIMTKNHADSLTPITKLIEEGKITTYIENKYELTEESAKRMFERAYSHRTAGKLVLQIVPEADATTPPPTTTTTSSSSTQEQKQP